MKSNSKKIKLSPENFNVFDIDFGQIIYGDSIQIMKSICENLENDKIEWIKIGESLNYFIHVERTISKKFF